MPYKDPEKARARGKDYYQKRRARQLAYHKIWWEINRETVSAKRRASYDPDIKRAQDKKYRDADPRGYIIQNAKCRAKKKRVEFRITKADIRELPLVCPILGLDLDYAYGKGIGPRSNSPSLDRIDARKGYVPGNVEIISHRANMIKSNSTVEELVLLLAYRRKQEFAAIE